MESAVWGLTGAPVILALRRLMSGLRGPACTSSEGRDRWGLGRKGEGEDAGKSEAGGPGHRIIIVKYSWAFGPDAISER